MFPTSDDYKKRIKALDRLFSLHIEIKHSKGTLVLTDEHIALGSFKHVSASQPSDDFTIGGAVASTLEFGIVNDIAYDDIVFDGAIIQPSIGVCLKPPGGHHYRHLELGEYPHWELGEYKHEQLMGMPLDITEEDFEYVPLGYFIVDEVNRLQTTITIKAVDEMIKLDKPYSESQLTYPATLSAIFADICSHCQVQQGTSSFVNMDYEVKERPVEDNVTFRTVLGWVAELAGSFAIFDRTSKLRLKWYEPTGMEYTGMNRFDFKPYDHEVQITGITYSNEDENKTYIVGTDDYAIDISNNALLQDKYETVLPKILDRVEDTKFYPFESDWQGDPALEPGDMITHHSETGFEYDTLITSTMFKYRGKSQFKGQGLPNKDNGLRNSTDQKIAQVTRKTNKRIEREVSALEQAQEQATKLLTDKLGGYVFKRENELLIMDAPNPERATKVWRWNLNGLGYSKNGINGPYETAITMDGQIVADFITTGILNADLIRTGILQSYDGSVRINLDLGNLEIQNGKLIVRDNLGQYIITSQGLRMKYLYRSNGGEGRALGWMLGGTVEAYDGVSNPDVPIFIYVPSEFIIESAILYTKSMPIYREAEDWSDIPEGYYHGRQLGLYTVDPDEIHFKVWGAADGFDHQPTFHNRRDITSATWGNRWSPTGDKIQTKAVDVKDYLKSGQRTVFTVKSNLPQTEYNARYMSFMELELELTGFLRG